MQNFEFQYPYLVLLLSLPIMVFYIFRIGKTESADLPILINPNIRQFAKAFGTKGSFRDLKGKFSYFLYLIWILIVIGLMHPQIVRKISKTTVKGYDIVMAIDLSKSMLALDFADKGETLNRLDVVKKIASKFIEKRQGDRLGLILFGENAYVQSPLTLDLNAVNLMLKEAEIGIAGDATAIGDAIALGVKVLKKRSDKSRILILMTDGSNTAGLVQPIEAAKLAKDFKVKIYTIQVGKKGPVPYPTENGTVIFAKIDSDEKVLKQISDITKGKFYSAEDKKNLESIYNEINLNEQTETEVSNLTIRSQLFQYPIILALLLLVIKLILSYNFKKSEA
jgi:Ca-activated chloride channel family protein